jgi:two-component system, NarL family, response regulator
MFRHSGGSRSHFAKYRTREYSRSYHRGELKLLLCSSGEENSLAFQALARIQLEEPEEQIMSSPRPFRRRSLRAENRRHKARQTNHSPDSPVDQIRVLIADDHPVAREGLSSILRSLKGVKVVGEAADGKEVCELYDQHLPDVLIVDLRMPVKDGVQVVTELMSCRVPKPRIIVITTYESEEDIRRAVAAGAKGYLVKAADAERIEEAVRAVAAGRTLFPTEITLKLAESVAHPGLTKRELEVLQYIANGDRGDPLYQRNDSEGSRQSYPDKAGSKWSCRSYRHRSQTRADPSECLRKRVISGLGLSHRKILRPRNNKSNPKMNNLP